MPHSSPIAPGSALIPVKPRPIHPRLTVIVPTYNEAENLRRFVVATLAVLAPLKLEVELLFVNDGSRDTSLLLLTTLSQEFPQITVLNLTRNFGKEAAVSAGIDRAGGDVIVIMDADLQHPPQYIEVFLEKWREGYDIIFGYRDLDYKEQRLKRLTSLWFYRMFNAISQTSIPPNAGDFRLLDARVVGALRALPERTRFMKGLFAWVGFPSIGVPYKQAAREGGATSWNYWKLWNFALEGIVSFSTAPLRIWSYLGGIIALLGFLYALIIILRVGVLGTDVPGYASIITAILFIGGIQLLSLGIIGEYIARLFVEVKARPTYLVEGIFRGGTKFDADADIASKSID